MVTHDRFQPWFSQLDIMNIVQYYCTDIRTDIKVLLFHRIFLRETATLKWYCRNKKLVEALFHNCTVLYGVYVKSKVKNHTGDKYFTVRTTHTSCNRDKCVRWAWTGKSFRFCLPVIFLSHRNCLDTTINANPTLLLLMLQTTGAGKCFDSLRFVACKHGTERKKSLILCVAT